MNYRGYRQPFDTPSYMKCSSCNFRYQYPGSYKRNEGVEVKESLRVPYVLRCGHSYCLVCLENRIQSSPNVFCSKCQTTTHVVDEVSSSLPPDFNMIGRTISLRSQTYNKTERPSEAVSTESKDFLCQDCSVSSARSLCLDCFVNYCNPCFQRIHFRNSSILSQHVQIPICRSGIIGNRSPCEVHSNQFHEVFCQTCNEMFCYKCNIISKKHKDHDHRSLNDMFQQNLLQLQSLAPRVERLLESIKSLEKKRKGNGDQAQINLIRSQFCQLHGLLLQKEEEIIQQHLSPSYGTSVKGSLTNHAQFLSDLCEDLKCLARLKSTNVEIHLNCDEINARVGLIGNLVSSAANQTSDNFHAFNFDASKFNSLLGECISSPAQSVPSSNFVKLECKEKTLPKGLSKQLNLMNVVEVVSTGSDDDVHEARSNSSRASTRADKMRPMRNELSDQFYSDLESQPKSYVNASLASGDQVYASHVVNPSKLYLQKSADSEQIQNLFNICQDMGNKKKTLNHDAFNRLEPGDMVLAQFSADKCWYRSRVLCTYHSCEGTQCVLGTVRVMFVDYGNCENVGPAQLKNITPFLENLADFAFQCDLHILPASHCWHKDASLALRDLVETERPFLVRVLDQKHDGTLVDLCRPPEQGGQRAFSLREHLVLRGFAKFPDGVSDPKFSEKSDHTDISLRDAFQTLSLESTTLPPTPISDVLYEPSSGVDAAIFDNSQEAAFGCSSQQEILSLTQNDNISNDSPSFDLTKSDAELNAALAEAFKDGPMIIESHKQVSEKFLSQSASSVNIAAGSVTKLFFDEDREPIVAHQNASQVELPDGISVTAICISEEKLEDVWVTVAEQNKTMAFEEGHPALSPTKWTCPPLIGGLYAARYVDNFFYRCVVEALLGQMQARVFFVDYGNTEVVNWQTDMAKLTSRFLAKPYMALLVTLAGITYVNKQITCDLFDKIQDLVTNCDNLYHLRYERNTDGGAKDSDAVYLIGKDACVNLQLVEHGLADFSSQWQRSIIRNLIACTQPQVSDPISNSSETVPPAPDPTPPPTFRTRDSTAPGRRARLLDPCSLVGVMSQDPNRQTLSTTTWEDDLSDDEAARLAEMPTCCVQRVITPSEFYVSMSDSNSLKEHERLCQAMNSHYNARKSQRVLLMNDLKIGELCAARRSGSPQWFRGRIIGPSSLGPRHVKVEFVDVGDIRNISVSSIQQPLARAIAAEWPVFAVRCHLIGVRPAGDNPDVWPKTATEKLRDLIKRCDKTAHLSRVADEDTGVGVDLILKEHPSLFSNEGDEVSDVSTMPARYISMRKAMLNFGVVLSKSYDPSLLRSNLVLRGLPLEISNVSESPHKAPPSGDFSDVNQFSTSEEDSTLEDHLYQSNNSNNPRKSAESASNPTPPRDSSFSQLSTVSDEDKSRNNQKSITNATDNVVSDLPFFPNAVLQTEDEIATPDPSFWPQQNFTDLETDDNGHDVRVMRIDDDLILYCKPCCDTQLEGVEQLANSQSEHLRLPPKPTIKHWCIYEACLALWQKEVMPFWCRAQIDSFNMMTNSATVYLIDYGVYIQLTNDLLRPIDVSRSDTKHPYLDIPPIVWRVKLHNIFPINPSNVDDLNNRTWPEGALDMIRSKMVDSIVTVFVVEVNTSSDIAPIVWSRVLFTDIQVEEEFGEFLCREEIAYRWEKQNPDQLFIKNPDKFQCYPNLDPMPVGVPLEVIVTAVETPNEIYLQYPIQEYQLQSLCHQWPNHSNWFRAAWSAHHFLQSTSFEEASLPWNYVAEITSRVACLARYSVDEKFYRAELLGEVESNRKNRVQFVDYGNFDDVETKDLRMPVYLDHECCCRRYRWKRIKRHPACSLERNRLTAEIVDTLTPLVIYAKCERIFRDGRLPLVDLFEDPECSRPLADILIEKKLLIRD